MALITSNIINAKDNEPATAQYKPESVDTLKNLLRGGNLAIDDKEMTPDLQRLLNDPKALSEIAYDMLKNGEKIYDKIEILGGQSYEIDIHRFQDHGINMLVRDKNGQLTPFVPASVAELSPFERERTEMEQEFLKLEGELDEIVEKANSRPITIDLDALGKLLDNDQQREVIERIREKHQSGQFIDSDVLTDELKALSDKDVNAYYIQEKMKRMMLEDPDSLRKIMPKEDVDFVGNVVSAIKDKQGQAVKINERYEELKRKYPEEAKAAERAEEPHSEPDPEETEKSIEEPENAKTDTAAPAKEAPVRDTSASKSYVPVEQQQASIKTTFDAARSEPQAPAAPDQVAAAPQTPQNNQQNPTV